MGNVDLRLIPCYSQVDIREVTNFLPEIKAAVSGSSNVRQPQQSDLKIYFLVRGKDNCFCRVHDFLKVINKTLFVKQQ